VERNPNVHKNSRKQGRVKETLVTAVKLAKGVQDLSLRTPCLGRAWHLEGRSSMFGRGSGGNSNPRFFEKRGKTLKNQLSLAANRQNGSAIRENLTAEGQSEAFALGGLPETTKSPDFQRAIRFAGLTVVAVSIFPPEAAIAERMSGIATVPRNFVDR